MDSVQTLTNEGLDSEKSGEKIEGPVEQHEQKEGGKRKSDVATAKDLSDLLELRRTDPRMMELREIKANRASNESLETGSMNGRSRDNRSNPLLHKLQDRKLSVSQQTLTNVSLVNFYYYDTPYRLELTWPRDN